MKMTMNLRHVATLWTAGLALALAGCASMDDPPASMADHSPVAPIARPVAPVATGGIYRPGVSEGLIGACSRS